MTKKIQNLNQFKPMRTLSWLTLVAVLRAPKDTPVQPTVDHSILSDSEDEVDSRVDPMREEMLVSTQASRAKRVDEAESSLRPRKRAKTCVRRLVFDSDSGIPTEEGKDDPSDEDFTPEKYKEAKEKESHVANFFIGFVSFLL